ncbi:hypothetical protein K505DRAFT_235237 [Melanomma pulvis-pyrius CBS 109.77]|uniref:DUF4211 domain-containing protein n=1 Tax=Melanomma pulvis-pyrius CBS 109.77 TaxID=1314802 RepID=A0A6A6XMG8_9PLEO|nr:hypothetical protein K505DRAFT_235237 [Melanomma pulvis-pyrius CBS 109.77]
MPDTKPPPKRARRTAVRQEPVRALTRKRHSRIFEVPQEISSGAEDVEEEDVLQRRKPVGRRPTVSTPRKQRLRRPLQEDDQQSDDEEDDSDSDVVPPRSTQKRRAVRDPQEQEDLEDDLEFLQSSPPVDRGGLRSHHTKPLSQREKALEELRRRRATSNGELSSSATPGRKRAIVLSDSDSELEVIPEEDDDVAEEDEVDEDEDEDEVDTDGEDQSYTHETNALDMFQEDINDVGFIDDDGPIGVPADLAPMPIEFSSLGRAKPRELFKYAIEWMVNRKINPSFPRSDEIYTLAFRKLDDEVKGLANSKYSSSIWTPDFTRALRARPEIMLNEIGTHMRAVISPHCEACNRKTHPATWDVTLTGAPYHKETLEPLVADSDSSSESDSNVSSLSGDSEVDLNGEKPTYDATGEQLPPESKIFTLGSTCKANAQMAHILHHWRYHLNSWVVDYLVREKHCTPEKIVERDTWSEKKREKYANKIVDKMEKDGEIRSLHKLYKNQVDFAFEAKNEYRQGWGRR